jgi:hypothetical protein
MSGVEEEWCPHCGCEISNLSSYGRQNHRICCRNVCPARGEVSIPLEAHHCRAGAREAAGA